MPSGPQPAPRASKNVSFPPAGPPTATGSSAPSARSPRRPSSSSSTSSLASASQVSSAVASRQPSSSSSSRPTTASRRPSVHLPPLPRTVDTTATTIGSSVLLKTPASASSDASASNPPTASGSRPASASAPTNDAVPSVSPLASSSTSSTVPSRPASGRPRGSRRSSVSLHRNSIGHVRLYRELPIGEEPPDPAAQSRQRSASPTRNPAAGSTQGAADATQVRQLPPQPPQPRRTHYDLTAQQLHEIREVFDLFDTDGSGSIDPSELRIVMRSLGFHPTKEEVRQMAAEFVDDDGEVSLSFEEFLFLMAAKLSERDTHAELMQAFQLFDVDGRGRIGPRELRRVARELGQPLADDEVVAIVECCDRDGDGEIGEEDW
ncbi:Centrin-1, partial [Cladochytrium tenue]